jgi:glycerol-3-phosphate O-acyltransferase 3/4
VAEGLSENEMARTMARLYSRQEYERLAAKPSLARKVLDISGHLQDCAQAMVDDTFWCCFQENHSDAWNWNVYLYPLWLVGVVLRYLVLFPLRLVALLLAFFAIFWPAFFLVHNFVRNKRLRLSLETTLIRFLCNAFVASWHGVVRFHGPAPAHRPNIVWVANHTSMIDFIILCSYQPCAVIAQKYSGWKGFLQDYVSAREAGGGGGRIFMYSVDHFLFLFIRSNLRFCP